MRKSLPKPAISMLLLLPVLFYSCTTKDEAKGQHSLTWTHNGTTYTADAADAYYSSNTIIAEKDVSTAAEKKHLEILLAGLPGPGFVAGTYTLANGGGNTLTYGIGTTPPSGWPYSVSGSLTISSKNGDIISGSFSATLNGTNGTISGTFTNLSID